MTGLVMESDLFLSAVFLITSMILVTSYLWARVIIAFRNDKK